MNFISPFGRIVKYEFPPLKGFFLHPKSDASSTGWTADRDPSGALILPGTPGGDGTRRFIGWSSAEPTGWNAYHTPGDYFYGEIDWVGKDKDPTKPSLGKMRLSYHGPNTRYFGTDKFRYGSSEEHNNIYMEGRCIAVAPEAVLGACLRVEEEELSQEQIDAGVVPEKILVLIAVCVSGGSETVYRRQLQSFSSGVTRPKYTEEFRTESQKLYSEQEPYGWKLIGSFSITEANQHEGATLDDPRVPWFFNESGTEAVCVRECDTKITIVGVEETQDSYNKFKLSVPLSGQSATYSDEGQAGPGFTVRIRSLLNREPDWENVTRWPFSSSDDLLHKWAVIDITQELSMTGFLIVASDYRGDEEVDLRYEITNSVRLRNFYYKGMDDWQEFFLVGKELQANTGDLYGDWVYVDSLTLDVDTVQEPYGRSASVYRINERAELAFPGTERHTVRRRLSGTVSEFETGESDPTDPYSFFVFYMAQHLHVLDLRNPYLASYVDLIIRAGYAELLKDHAKSEQLYNGKDPKYLVIYEAKDPQVTTPPFDHAFPVGKVWGPGASPIYPGEYTWDVEHIEEYTVLDGRWYTACMQPGRWPNNVPSPLEYYHASNGYSFDTDETSVREILQSVANGYREMGSGVDDFGHLAFSLEYRDQDGNLKYYNYLDDGSMDTLTHAVGDNTRFFPIGVS